MAKASTDTTEAPKRAPRKRAVRRVVETGEAPVRRRTRAAAPRVETEAVTPRKAPAYIVESAAPSSSKKFLVALASFVVVVGAASWIGFSDAGQIDVNERINTSSQEAADVANAESTTGDTVNVPVQNTPPAAISGIRPRTDGGGQPAVVPPPVEETTEGATTTDAAAETEGEASTGSTSTEEESTPPAEGEAVAETDTPQIAE